MNRLEADVDSSKIEVDPAVRKMAQFEVSSLSSIGRESSPKGRLARMFILMTTLVVGGLEMLPGRAEAATRDEDVASKQFDDIQSSFEKFNDGNSIEIKKQLSAYELGMDSLEKLPLLDQVNFLWQWAYTQAQVVENIYAANSSGEPLYGTLEMGRAHEKSHIEMLAKASKILNDAEVIVSGYVPQSAEETKTLNTLKLKIKLLAEKIETTQKYLRADDIDIVREKDTRIKNLKKDLELAGYTVGMDESGIDMNSPYIDLKVTAIKDNKTIDFLVYVNSQADGTIVTGSRTNIRDTTINSIVDNL